MNTPIRAEVYLIYQCPQCKCEWGQTPKAVVQVGAMVCENCNFLIRFEPIRNVRVIPVYVNPPKTSKPVLTSVQKYAIKMLVQRGFPKRETVSFVKAHKFTNVNDYIQGAIRLGLS